MASAKEKWTTVMADRKMGVPAILSGSSKTLSVAFAFLELWSNSAGASLQRSMAMKSDGLAVCETPVCAC